MAAKKADIIARLQREILSLQGHKPISNAGNITVGLDAILRSFPQACFPIGVHEFMPAQMKDGAAASGFMSALLASVINKNGIAAWISASRKIFPPALKKFGIQP